jgi:hypothetical protein
MEKLTLLVKLGSIAVHAEEFFGDGGYHVDAIAIKNLIADREVQQWIKSMGPLLPLKRLERPKASS